MSFVDYYLYESVYIIKLIVVVVTFIVRPYSFESFPSNISFNVQSVNVCAVCVCVSVCMFELFFVAVYPLHIK